METEQGMVRGPECLVEMLYELASIDVNQLPPSAIDGWFGAIGLCLAKLPNNKLRSAWMTELIKRHATLHSEGAEGMRELLLCRTQHEREKWTEWKKMYAFNS